MLLPDNAAGYARATIFLIVMAVGVVVLLAHLEGNDGGIGNRGGQNIPVPLSRVEAGAQSEGVSLEYICSPGAYPIRARQDYPGTFEIECSDGVWSGAVP